MSGHSHSSNIAHRKGIVDAKRAKLWSKLSRAIMVAARHGGGDPIANLKLRYAIDKAREVSMPKDNIERAIKKGTGEGSADVMDEVTYEGYGPAGVAILVEALTENRNRTNGEVRRIFDRMGGKIGTPGSVSYLFERKGIFVVDAKKSDEETLMALILNAGADDLQRVDNVFEITCDPTIFNQMKAALDGAGLATSVAELQQVGKTTVDTDVETGQKILKLLEALDDSEDVQNVYSNLNVTAEMVG